MLADKAVEMGFVVSIFPKLSISFYTSMKLPRPELGS
jgi:hypothetical protein